MGRLTDPDTGRVLPTPPQRSRLAELRGPALFVVGAVAAYALLGLGAGWLWHELWTPAEGVVIQHEWYPDGDALRDDFSGTGLYVLVAAGAGLVLGLVCAIVGGRRPLVTVGAAVAGSALAAWLMTTMGERLGPADPHELAKTLDDGKKLPSALAVTGFSPTLAFTIGTLLALAVVFTIFPGKTREAGSTAEPRG
jgi:hypothetical protein